MKEKTTKMQKREVKRKGSSNTIKSIDTKKLLGNLIPVSDYLKGKGEEAVDILELFPDIARGLQRVATSVVSPNDIIKDKILYSVDIPHIDKDVELSKALRFLSSYMDETYNLTSEIDSIVYDALCVYGSVMYAFIPNNDTKIIEKSIIGFESTDKEYITVTSNSSILNSQDIIVKNATTTAFESMHGESVLDLTNIFSDDGLKPIYKKIPINAGIPIISKNNPSKHLAYAILLGEDGEILSPIADKERSTSNEMLEYLSGVIDKKNISLVRVKTSKPPSTNTIKSEAKSFIGDKLAKQIEEELGYKGFSEDVVDRLTEIAFSRLLNKKRTRVVMLNPIQVSYLAFTYRSNGTGKSLLDGLTLILSIRATILFRKLYAYLESIKTNVKAEITLSETDDDPENTLETLIKNIRDALGVDMPLWSTRVEDFVKSAQESGLSVAVNGEGIYDTKVEITKEKVEVNMPDDELSEEFKRLSLMHINRPYDLLDTSNNPEFAAEVLNEHKLFTKKAMADQKIVNSFLTDHVRKAIINDRNLQNKLIEHLDNDKEALNSLVKYLKVKLPEFDYDILDGLSDKFSTFTSALDDLLSSIFDDGIASGFYTGAITDNVDTIKGIIRYNRVREWCIEHNYFPEIFNSLETDDGNIDYNTVNSIMDAIGNNIKLNTKDNKNLRRRIETIFEKLKDLDSADNEPETPLEDKKNKKEGDSKPEDKKGEINEDGDEITNIDKADKKAEDNGNNNSNEDPLKDDIDI